MVLRKKGIFFTVTILVVIALFLITYSISHKIDNRESTKTRVNSLNNFVFSIEEDLSRQLFISGFRSIFLIQERMLETGSYETNLQSSINELFYNGSLEQNSKTIMNGATFQDIQDNINTKSKKINLNITLYNPTVIISQSTPWEINFSIKTDFTAKDISNQAFWNATKIYSALIPITSFEDPIYFIETSGALTNKITKTPYNSFVNSSNITNFINHATTSYYTNSTQAPSFLDRLQGITSPNENGIESLVNLIELSSQGVSAKDKSIVDYVYFSDNNPVNCQINGAPPWIKIDQSHLVTYELTGLEYNC